MPPTTLSFCCSTAASRIGAVDLSLATLSIAFCRMALSSALPAWCDAAFTDGAIAVTRDGKCPGSVAQCFFFPLCLRAPNHLSDIALPCVRRYGLYADSGTMRCVSIRADYSCKLQEIRSGTGIESVVPGKTFRNETSRPTI
jgi:hypothetical protein